MARKIGKAARDELVIAIGQRYRGASRVEKSRILDEFVAVTGYHRKHAVRLLSSTPRCPRPTRSRPCIYDDAVREALIVLWEASDRVCGKRLRPLLPVLIPALERHGHLHLDEAVRTKLLSVSASTIDRMLGKTRDAAHGRQRTRPRAAPAAQRAVPVRTFADWREPLPGYMEADLVGHCGNRVAGSFVHTFVLTDIATTWTECAPLLVREGSLVTEALDQLRTTMPFPLRGFDSDNGSEFINEVLVAYCEEHGIEFTRSRPYHKNDQAWVEQKNGSVVRRLVGYGRLEGIEAADALSRLYAASRLFVNFFQPSFKLAEKKRIGSRVQKRYHAPETPCARLLASEAVPEAMKERLREVAITLDPLRLLDEIRTAQHELARLAAGETAHTVEQRDAELDGFLRSLATAWQDGEVRPTHRQKPKPRRYWRTRQDPFAEVWPRVQSWLEAQPDRTAKELFQRLQGEHPGIFPPGQLRTFQRRVKAWRRAAARRLVFATNDLPNPTRPPGDPSAILGEVAGSIPP